MKKKTTAESEKLNAPLSEALTEPDASSETVSTDLQPGDLTTDGCEVPFEQQIPEDPDRAFDDVDTQAYRHTIHGRLNDFCMNTRARHVSEELTMVYDAGEDSVTESHESFPLFINGMRMRGTVLGRGRNSFVLLGESVIIPNATISYRSNNEGKPVSYFIQLHS